MKTISKQYVVPLALVLALFGGCGSPSIDVKEESPASTTPTTASVASTPTSTSAPTPAATPAPAPTTSQNRAVPQQIKTLLDEKCSQRPNPIHLQTTNIDFTEARLEEDEGDFLVEGKKLHAKNLIGTLYVEPSSDGKFYWAIRKWVFAKDETEAKRIQKNIAITSATNNDEAQVIVNHPDSTLSYLNNGNIVYGEGYQTCLVLMAPANVAHSLENLKGNITSVNHNAALIATASSGNISVRSFSAGGVQLKTGSGNIDYLLQGAGVLATSGSLETTSGNVVITVGQVGLQMDASVTSGIIKAGSESVVSGALVTSVNGGGATVTTKVGSGNILLQ